MRMAASITLCKAIQPQRYDTFSTVVSEKLCAVNKLNCKQVHSVHVLPYCCGWPKIYSWNSVLGYWKSTLWNTVIWKCCKKSLLLLLYCYKRGWVCRYHAQRQQIQHTAKANTTAGCCIYIPYTCLFHTQPGKQFMPLLAYMGPTLTVRNNKS